VADAPDRETAKPLTTFGGVEPAIHVERQDPGLEGFDVWTPSMGFYVVFAGVCALLIDSGRLQDVYFCMSGVAAVNVGLFYLVKCGRHGAESAAGLPGPSWPRSVFG
jgi:hypothetical protein